VKNLKMLVLAAIAAVAATAMAGTGMASATVLCKTNTAPCSEKHPAGTELKASLASGTSMQLTSNSLGTADTCTGGSIAGKTSNAGSSTETVRASVSASSLTWSGCVWPITTVKGIELEIHSITGSDNGTVTGKGLEISMDTGSLGGICTYSLGTISPHIGVITGGSSPTLHVSALMGQSGSNLICTDPVRWTGTYTLTSPTPLYVR
jgi:hypothetical protein